MTLPPLKKAEELAKRARAGEDFATLAQQNSDDPGSKSAGGDLGWSTREAYVPAFADALFGIKQQGEIRGPVKTQFGYHVIRLDGIEAPAQRSFEEVRAELETQYRAEQAQSLFYEKSQQLADESFAALSELDSVSKKLGLPVQTVEGYTRQGGGPFGNDRKIIDAVFSEVVLEERQNSPPVELGNDSVVVLRITDHKPSQQQSLEAVRGAIDIEPAHRRGAEGSHRCGRGHCKARQRRRIFCGGRDCGGFTADDPQSVTRRGAVGETAAPVAPEMLKPVFRAPRPAGPGKASAGTVMLASGDPAVFVVTAVKSGSVASSPDATVRMPERAQAAQQFGRRG